MDEIRRERAAAVATGDLRRISWGAIIAGALLALAVQFMLGLLGLGIGLATFDTNGTGSFDPNTFASTGGLWTVAVVLIGLFVGAYAAGRLAGSPSKTDAALHGLVTWATSTLLVIFLLTSGTSAVLGAAFGAIGGSIEGLSRAASASAPDMTAGLRPEVDEAFRRRAVTVQPRAEGETETDVQQAVGSDDAMVGRQEPGRAFETVMTGLGEQATPEQRRAAAEAIASQAGISQSEAQQRLQQLQQTYDSVQREARRMAAEAARAVSAGSFAAFVALVLGLITGAVGGLVGRPRHRPAASRV